MTTYTRQNIYNLIKAGNFPKPIQFFKSECKKRGSKLLWDIEDIHNWVNNKKEQNNE